MIVWRQSQHLFYLKNYKLAYYWLHDTMPVNEVATAIQKAHKAIVLSMYHRRLYGQIPAEKLLVSRNGINTSQFSPKPKNKNHIIYASSYDRGLKELLEMWPEIKTEVQDAVLHICYGWETWEEISKKQGEKAYDNFKMVKEEFEELMNQEGIIHHGRIGHQELADLFETCEVWAYPTWWPEISCQPAGSPVFTKNGVKNIEDVSIGDEVLTHDGRFMPVTNTISKHFSGNLVGIKRHKDPYYLWFTPEHEQYEAFLNNRTDSNSGRVYSKTFVDYKWSESSAIDNSSFLVTPTMEDSFKNKTATIGRKKVVIDESLSWALGLFAADGSSTPSVRGKDWFSKISFGLNNGKKLFYIPKLEKVFGTSHVRKSSENGIDADFHDSNWARWLNKEIGVGRDKKIPSVIWDSPLDVQMAFVGGITDGDGCTRIKRGATNHRYTTVSRSLAYGVAQILSNSGIFPSISYCKKRENYDLSWNDTVRWPQHWKRGNNFITRVDSTKTKPFDGLVYDIEVSGDHSYLSGRTAVHNCITAMKSQASGCVPIIIPTAAVAETIKFGKRTDRGYYYDLRGNVTRPEEALKQFSEKMIEVLRDDEYKKSEGEKARKYAIENLGWDKLAKEWIKEFKTELEANGV